MKNTYKQLSCEERDKIAILRAQGISYYDISITIGRDKSTISREINRNRTPIYNVYLPHKAHERAKERKQKAGIRDRLKNQIIMTYVVNKLKLSSSPEQISGRLPSEHPNLKISHEAIYQYIYDKEHRKLCDLTIYLARANNKRKRHGHSNKHQKSHIPHRASIDKPPYYIENEYSPATGKLIQLYQDRVKKPSLLSLNVQAVCFILQNFLPSLRESSKQLLSAV